MKKLLSLLLAIVMVCGLVALVACGKEEEKTTQAPTTTPTEPPIEAPEVTGIEAAAEYVRQLYKDYKSTAVDFTVIPSIVQEGVAYQIAWTVDTDQVKVVPGEDANGNAIVTIDIVPEEPEADIPYVLKATLTDAEGNTATVEFNITVPKFEALTWEEYFGKKAEEYVVVEGIVTGIVSESKDATNNCIFLQDADEQGGYYIYGMTEDPIAMGIEIGMTVRASGTKDIYNGTHEVKPNGVKIVSTEKTAVTPIDITEAYKNAEDLKAKDLFNLQGALVTIKGVEITDQKLENGYYNFILAGKTSYVRISGSTCAINKADQATFAANHTANRGNTADATGIVSVYNGAIYLVPVTVDSLSNFQVVERTDAEKVEYEAGNITVDSAIHSNKTITLPVVGATYSNVTISWVSDNACAVVDGGNVTFTLQDEAQTVKLTATITLGENTATKEFTITVDAKPTVVPSVVETPAADTAYKFFIAQANLGQTLYLDGGVDGRYLTTTTDVTEAIDVYAEAVDGGFKFYILVDGAKQYIEVYNNAENKLSVQYNAEGASVYTYNAETDAWATTLDGETYYLGTYNNFATVSASKTSYINAGNTHVSQFPMELATLIDIADCVHVYSGDCDATCNICDAARDVEAEHTYDNACDAACNVCGAERTPADHVYDNACDATCNVCEAVREVADHADNDGDGACDSCGMVSHTHVDANGDFVCDTDGCNEIVIAAETAYRFFINQATLGKTLYLDGGVSGRYLTMTENAAEAVDVYAEAVDGGYKFYILVDGAKQYIEIYSNDDSKISVKYDAAGTCVYTYNATTYAWETTVDGQAYYLGTYSTFDTVSASKTSYINADNTRVSQFPLELTVIVDAAECDHAYDNDCDAFCNKCGVEREVADHVYDNACDATCNVCEAVREVADHADSDGDSACDACGATMHVHADANGDFVCDADDCDVIVIAADTAFRMSINQVTLGKTLYLNGGVNGRYLTMTENVAEAVDVYAEAVDGGYKFYILVDGAKQYIEIYNNDEGKLSVKYDAAGTCVYTYNATTYAWETTVDGQAYYLGTYSNYNTVSASKTSYISAENTGVSQFPLELTVIVDAAECEHAYDNDCDATCNICGAEREVADHVYDNACDATCNVCEARREVADHVDAEPDYVCDECGAALKQPGVEGESVTASKTIAELIASEGWTSSTTKQSFALDSVVTVKVDGGNNSGKAYNGDHIRIYATDTPAGTLTISVADGYELVSVKVTTAEGTYAFLCVGDSTEDISNESVEVSGSSVVLNSVKNGSDGKQVRVMAIEVVYAAV